MRIARRRSGPAQSGLWAAALAMACAFACPPARASEYDAHVVGASPNEYEAVNPAQSLNIVFSSHVTIRPASPAPPWEIGITLASAGYRSAPQLLATAVPRATANRVDEQRGSAPALSEWYVNDVTGLQQWIRIDAPFASDWRSRTEPIVLDFDMMGGLKPSMADDGRGVDLLDEGSRIVMRAEQMSAAGADGTIVPLRLEPRADAQGRVVGVRVLLARGYVPYPIVFRAFLRSAKSATDAAAPPTPSGTGPSNDGCTGATPIPDGPYPVLSAVTTGVDTASSDGDPQPSCIAASSENGVWYTWTPSATQVYTLSTCADATGTNPGDGVLAVYTSAGCGTPFSEIGCDDDGCASYGPSVIGPQLFQGGVTYYILASHYPVASGGGAPITQYQIRIEGPSGPPPNDLCQGAEVLPGAGPFPWLSSIANDVRGATTNDDPPLPACQQDVSRSLWYRFTPAVSSLYAIETCAGATATSLEDTILSIYTSASGTCAGPFTPLADACNDDGCARQATVTAPLTAGTTYYILVWQYGVSPPPSGSTAVQLRVAPLTPPANDSCHAPGTLPLERPVVGTVAGSEDDYRLAGNGCFTGIGQVASSAEGRDVTYAFTAPIAGAYSFRAQDLGASGDLVLYVAADCPPPTSGTAVTVDACLAASNRNAEHDPYAATEEVSCVPLAAGQTVYVFVDRDVRATTGDAFRLEASRCEAEMEPNPTPASATSPMCGMEGSITAGDVDYFALGPTSPDSRVFALVDGAAAGSTDFDMRVTTASSTLEYDDLNADTPFGALSPVVAGTRSAGSDAFLRINHYASEVASEPYRLFSVVQCPAATATPETEPNDSAAQADEAENDYFLGSLAGPSASSDIDVYRFQALAGTVVFLGLDNDPDFDGTCTDTRLELWDAGGALLAVNDPGAVSNARTPVVGTQTSTSPVACAESLAFRVDHDGAYLALVGVGTGAAGASARGSYLLSIAPDCTASCSDGNACTVHDTCRHGACVGGEPANCDDGNPCTSDSCDPAAGCLHAPIPGLACDDGDPCTLGDACSAGGTCASGPPRDCDDGNTCTRDACDASGACTHSPNNTCGGSPKGQGYWKRLCRGPIGSGDRYMPSDIDCVNDTCLFGSVTTLADLCDRLTPSPPNDKCEQAEAQLMALTLNFCRGRVLDAEPIASQCTTHRTVLESRLDAGVLLCKPNRTFADCQRAQCESEEINSGEALFTHSLRLQMLPGGSIRLTWQPPVSSDTFAPPRAYRVWRASSPEAPFVMLGETSDLAFTDTNVPPGNWQYEITIAW